MSHCHYLVQRLAQRPEVATRRCEPGGGKEREKVEKNKGDCLKRDRETNKNVDRAKRRD